MDDLVERCVEAMCAWTNGDSDMRGKVWVINHGKRVASFDHADEAYAHVKRLNAKAIIPLVYEDAANIAFKADADIVSRSTIMKAIRSRSMAVVGES